MKLKVTFDEIIEQVQKRFHVAPTLKMVDYKTIEASYKPMPFIKVALTIKVLEIHNDGLTLKYDAGTATMMMLQGAIELVKEHLPEFVTINDSAKTICINASKIEKADKMLEMLQLKDVCFDADGVDIELKLKQLC